MPPCFVCKLILSNASKIMGWTMGPLAALSGGRVPAYIPIGPTPRSKVVVDLVQSCHASQALLTTKQLEELHRKPDSVKILASLRCVWYSGAKLALGAKMRLEQAGVRLLSMYYVTEAGPLGMTHQTPKPGTEPCSGEWITLRVSAKRKILLVRFLAELDSVE